MISTDATECPYCGEELESFKFLGGDLVACRACDRMISTDAEICPFCSEDQDNSFVSSRPTTRNDDLPPDQTNRSTNHEENSRVYDHENYPYQEYANNNPSTNQPYFNNPPSKSENSSQPFLIKLIIWAVICFFSYYEGILRWDGGLFRGFFMQLLFMVSGVMAILCFIRLIVHLIRK